MSTTRNVTLVLAGALTVTAGLLSTAQAHSRHYHHHHAHVVAPVVYVAPGRGCTKVKRKVIVGYKRNGRPIYRKVKAKVCYR